MSEQRVPVKHYQKLVELFPATMSALEDLGEQLHKAGPIDEKTAQLIQLAGAAAIQSEGAVHSHTRRAIQAGASQKEIYHTLLLLTSTIGFPRVNASITWAQDILSKKDK